MTALSRRFVLTNRRGLHARASAKFVEMADRFEADVTVAKEGGEAVGADSIMELLTLVAGPGTELTVAAEGPEAEEALDALERLVSERFGEGE